MYEQKMDSTFSEELEAMEALEAYVSRLFFYDVYDLDCTMPQQENGYLVVTGPGDSFIHHSHGECAGLSS